MTNMRYGQVNNGIIEAAVKFFPWVVHNALVVVGQVKEVTIVVNFKVALLSPEQRVKIRVKLDPVGSTVRYEMMKLCTGSI